MEGTITDTTGAAVVGVRVSITAAAGGRRYEAMSDSHGHYQIPSPVAGTYSIKAEQSGFGPKTSQVTVVAGESAHADIQLGIASISQDVVVTGAGNVEFGAKSGIPIEQAPQSIQVLNQEDFKNMDVHSIGDVLKAVPSATPGAPRTSTYQYFSQRIRGFVPVQIVNGVFPRYYANIDPSATSNIERIEVLKGPSAVLYGQTGVGGIISIVTKQPQHDFAGSVSVIGGQYDRFAGSFDVTGPVRDLRGVYFRATGEIERSGTYIRYLPINRDNGAFSVNWEASNRVTAHFVSQWQERDTLRNPGLPALGTVISNGIATISRSTFLGEPKYNGLSGRSNFTATGPLIQAWVDIKLNDNWVLTPRISYSGFTGTYSEINLGAVQADKVTVNRTGRYDIERHHYPIEQVDAAGTVKVLGMTHHLVLGAENNDRRVGFTQDNMPTVTAINVLNPVYGTVPDGPYPVSQVQYVHYTDWSVHGQDRIDVTDRLNVILGIRGDWFINHRTNALNGGAAAILDTSFSKPTGQAGATYRLNRGWSGNRRMRLPENSF